MAFLEGSTNTRSRHWLRMPAPHVGTDFELFTFTGVALFNSLKGTGSSWIEGDANIIATYPQVIGADKAILTQNWTVDVGLASISNKNHAVNTGWSVNKYSLRRIDNKLGGGKVAAAQGNLGIDTLVAMRDIDAKILRLSYNVTILGKVVDWESTIDIGD